MTVPTREDFEAGVSRMRESHPASESPQERYDKVLRAMRTSGFTPDELRGMLAVALDRIAALVRAS